MVIIVSQDDKQFSFIDKYRTKY